MYRGVTLAVLRAGIDPGNQQAILHLLANLQLEMPTGQVLLDGEDVTKEIRAARVTQASGRVADSPVVREYLVKLQRAWAVGRNIVCEGRDQGTVVFPRAECKFFLVADPHERARRRQQEMAARGEIFSWDEILRAQEERDNRDAARVLAPMVPAADAILVDTTDLRLEQVVDRLEQEVRKKDQRSDEP
jgi:cytidylate kinase